ncbi:MAG: hypothetical protein HC921_21940 [Synechococcaceae cyanobacterium SM2_3_1]|nr:hypothetical protein [Synechococcaceae cyanobacterium SM2_3_1]
MDDNLCTLREAILANNVNQAQNGCPNPNGTITFANSLLNSSVGETIIISNSPLPTITANVEILGLGSDKLTVNGNNQFRVFDISSNLKVTIAGLTIANGITPTDGNAFNQSGGGIRAGEETNLILRDSTLSGNNSGSDGGPSLWLSNGEQQHYGR